MKNFEQLALIGSTASGKTALSIKIAEQMNAHILSLDSLSIYKDIDIVSAKPTIEERKDIIHCGIDVVSPDEIFDVTTYIQLYSDVHKRCLEENKNLVIVGGTSFYLKMLIEGISTLPSISIKAKNETSKHLQNLEKTYQWLNQLDGPYMRHIESKDTYRIEKVLNIYFETSQTPTEYFQLHPPKPAILDTLPIYQIIWDKAHLRKRIVSRTNTMVHNGLIDEICFLEHKYTRSPDCMKAIGIKETLSYLDGIYDRKMLIEKISINTARLAKRQTTFNNSQFKHVIKGNIEELEKILL